ncbi:methyltransferase domain-containing protein [bacterium]|nr:methyltransferase domain-containing protein [bacterium]
MIDQGPVALYDSLARFQWWRRALTRNAPGSGLEMRKRLTPSMTDGPLDNGSSLDQWLINQAANPTRDRILDLGCGFGASLLRWMPKQTVTDNGHAFGVTPSAYQIRRARQISNQLGVGPRCTFLQQNLEADLPSDLDVVLAIEALGHTQNLSLVLQNVRKSLRPGGTLIWLEDLLNHPATDDVDVSTLARDWSSPPLRDLASIHSELNKAGLQVVLESDLTPQVPHRSLPQIERSCCAANRWRRLLPLPFARRIAQAFLGGFALERLYARDLACYRLFVATAPVTPE